LAYHVTVLLLATELCNSTKASCGFAIYKCLDSPTPQPS